MCDTYIVGSARGRSKTASISLVGIVNSFPFSMTEAPTNQRILFLIGLIISERRALRASTVKTKRAQEAVALQRTAASSSRMASICVYRMLTT